MIRVRTLGDCAIEVGANLVTPDAEIIFAALLYLAENAGRRLLRDELLDVLWADCPRVIGLHRLRQTLHKLRKLGVQFESSGNSILLPSDVVSWDYGSLTADDTSGIERSDAVIHGEFLPHYAPSISVSYSQWLERKRERVHDHIRIHLLTALRSTVRANATPDVERLARACLKFDPLNEEATLALAEAIALQGDAGRAIRILDSYSTEVSSGLAEPRSVERVLRRRISESLHAARHDNAPEPTLVGRTEIMRQLIIGLGSRSNRESRSAVLIGDAGIGKTRLLREVSRVATVRGWRCLYYRPSPTDRARPLAGVLSILPQLLDLPGAVGCSPPSFSLLSQLAKGLPTASRPPDDERESSFRFATLRRSILDLLQAAMAESKVLAAIDDVHWLDRESLDLLYDTLVHGANHSRLVIFMAARPDPEIERWLSACTDLPAMRVPPLDRGSARTLISSLVERDRTQPRPGAIEGSLDLANGNPFYLVELAEHCRSDIEAPSLPESLQVAIQRRIAGLSPQARLVVETCALLRQASTLGRIEQIVEYPAHENLRALTELEAASLITTTGCRVCCNHDLIADEIVASIPPSARTYLHRRAALTLEAEFTQMPNASIAWDCAFHWESAGDHRRAVQFVKVSAEQLLSLGLPGPAAEICERATRYCASTEEHAELLFTLSRAKRLVGDWPGVVDTLERRRRLLDVTARPSAFVEDDVALFEARWWRDFDQNALGPAVERVADASAPSLHRMQMAVLALIVADNHQMRPEADRLIRLAEQIGQGEPTLDQERARADLIYHTAFGDLDRAVSAAESVVATQRRIGESAALLLALRWASLPFKFANHVSRARAALEEAFDIAAGLDLTSEMWHAALYLADLGLDLEELTLADRWARTAVELAELPPLDHSKVALSAYVLARVALMSDATSDASALLAQSLRTDQPVMRTRAEESALALDLLLRVKIGTERIPEEVLKRLETLHIRSRTCGTRDFETGALVLGLQLSGAPHHARELWGAYTQCYRRTRLRPHSVLSDASRRLGSDVRLLE